MIYNRLEGSDAVLLFSFNSAYVILIFELMSYPVHCLLWFALTITQEFNLLFCQSVIVIIYAG